jgi:hypothetical protein
VAATDFTPNLTTTQAPGMKTALLTAALALPGLGLVAMDAHAETAPERGYVALKVLDYLDSQPGADRIRVKAPALSALVPLGDQWSMTGTLITDSISGASPAYYNAAITPMHDFRRAYDASVTRYLPQGTWSLGASHSKESDYLSRSLYGTVTRSNESKNTTWNLGGGLTRDAINPNNHVVENETKQTVDLLAGVTQVMGINDIAQINLGWSQSQGYLSDPYKVFDERPRLRTHQTVQTRWNHHVDSLGSTERLAYRYFQDSWGIRAHTFDLEHVHPLGEQWKATAALRYHSQNAARFYIESDGSAVGPFGPNIPQGAAYYALDQRLSAYCAVTYGLKLTHQWDANTVIDFKLENYEQRGSWALGTTGSANLLPFKARSLQWGLTRWF